MTSSWPPILHFILFYSIYPKLTSTYLKATLISFPSNPIEHKVDIDSLMPTQCPPLRKTSFCAVLRFLLYPSIPCVVLPVFWGTMLNLFRFKYNFSSTSQSGTSDCLFRLSVSARSSCFAISALSDPPNDPSFSLGGGGLGHTRCTNFHWAIISLSIQLFLFYPEYL